MSNAEAARRYREKNRAKLAGRPWQHGPWIVEDRVAMWARQEGRCYLCGCDLTGATCVIDHDHGCCPPQRSCRNCRRGLACNNCNTAIGLASDDPQQLRRMADRLEAAQAAVRERMATKPHQPELLAVGSPE